MTILPTEDDVLALQRCPPVADLDEGTRTRVLQSVAVLNVQAGSDVITQGTPGDAFYVLLQGRAEVLKRDEGVLVKLTELQPGAYFGEQALLGKKSGLRSATVRALVDCRIAAVAAEVFANSIAASGQNRDRFEGDAATYVYRELSRSLSAFVATELGESTEGVLRRSYTPGQTLVREGQPSDSAFLILWGIARVHKNISGEDRVVSRMGSGQFFGEVGVLQGGPRTATVVADSDMDVLQISADAFVRWHRAHPDAAGFFRSLSNVYRLSEGRQLSVFWGEVGGAKAVTSVIGSSRNGVVATRVLDQGVVVFANAAASGIAGERSVMKYADPKIKRELRLIVRERRGEKIERGVVYGVAAEGIENDLGTLYQHVLTLDEVQAVALRRFERTGFLGGRADKPERLCRCLGLSKQDLTAAAKELGRDFSTIQASIGIGGICGGCEPAVRAFLDCGQPSSETAHALAPPVSAASHPTAPTAPTAKVPLPPEAPNGNESRTGGLAARIARSLSRMVFGRTRPEPKRNQ